ncbi:hypothetical protein SLEP1_g19398 [Rubroshorea leprosula]|nr:hypothetical protein SLEP1_g19398 [Rubroshorea leprosula]
MRRSHPCDPLNHTVTDAVGLMQFMTAVCEMAQGESVPSLMPIWDRHLLNARYPPRLTCTHDAFDGLAETEVAFNPPEDMVLRSFFFGPSEVSTIRKTEPNKKMRAICVVNARSKFNPPIPIGYYGNVIVQSTALTRAGKLCQNSLAYALELVKQAKANITEEYMKSTADLMVIRGRPRIIMDGTFLVSDVTRPRFTDVNFGWGKAVYVGPATGGGRMIPWVISFFIPMRNKKGKDGIVVPFACQL